MLRWASLEECSSTPHCWVVEPFLHVVEVIAGQSPPSETYNEVGNGLPFLQGNADFSAKYPSPKLWCSAPQKTALAGDTLISVRAPVGEVNRADQDYAIGRGLAALRAKTLDPDFLYHAIQRWRWCLQRVAQGTTFDAITARHFEHLRVAVPSDINEQAAIARILDAADAAIERTRVAIELARQSRTSLLSDLLSNGVDDTGQVRNPDTDPRQFTRTALGLLPVAWRLSSVGAEFTLQTGFTLNESRQPRYNRRPYLRVANVQRDALLLDDVQELEATDEEFAPRTLAVDDLLVVEGHADRMQIGRCARVTEEAAGLTFQNHLYRLRPSGDVQPYFGCLWLNSTHAQRYWNARCATSSGLNTINQRMLKRLTIPVPSQPEQSLLAALIVSQRQHIEALVAKLRSQEQLKKSLMHDLLTGTVRVQPRQIEAELQL
jgi:type I restriction enzyme, S subunit